MGWRNVSNKGTEVLVGDGGFDAVDDMLRAMTSEYEKELGRKPSLEEVLMTIEMVLKAFGDQHINGLDELEIVEVKAKTKQRPKKQRCQEGDFFAVPLGTGRFGYGRVLRLEGGTIHGFYDFVSDTIQLPTRFADKPFLFIIMGTAEGLESWRWKVVGGAPLRPGEFTMPDFWVRDGADPTKARIYSHGKYRNATPAEASHLELFAIWPPEGVEERLVKELKAKGRIRH